MIEIKFRYVVLRPNGHIFSRMFTLSHIETGDVKQWLKGNHVGATDKVMKLQYSGLTDKNGIEIFEGDIAKSVFGVGKVFRDDRGFRFEFDTDSDGLWEMCTGIEGRTFEVIGNIYQNPELMT